MSKQSVHTLTWFCACAIVGFGCGSKSDIEMENGVLIDETPTPRPMVVSTDNGARGQAPIGTTPVMPVETNSTESESEMDIPNEDPMTTDTDQVSNSDSTGLPVEALTLDNLIDKIAVGTCEALSRCCDMTEVDSFFGSLANNAHLEDIKNIFPPMTPFDSETCPSVIKQAYEIVPFGPWVKAVRENYASFDAEAAQGCIDEMQQMACGEPFQNHMFAGECFGFTAPFTSVTRRRAFTRKNDVGDACMRLTDGVGGGFFGTCKPETSWCARVMDDGRQTIASSDQPGTCVRAGAEGDACGLSIIESNGPSMSICQTGLECSSADESVCFRPVVNTLSIGDRCYDSSSFTTLGSCQDGYCDLLGTYRCEDLKVIGTTCSAAYECESNYCNEGTCRDGGYCDGF